jgi:hypothetical protein
VSHSAGSRFRIIANATVALGLAAFVALATYDLDKVWNAGAYGNYAYGITFGDSNDRGATVAAIDSGSAAQKAGLKPGDTLEPATPRDKSLLLLIRLPGANLALGQRLSLFVIRPGMRRAVTLQALAFPQLSFGDSVAFVLLYAGLYVCLSVGLSLVLFRPSKITWAFFLVMISVFAAYNNFPSIFASRWGANYTFGLDLILSAVAVGFLIFCIRFPADAPTDWRKRLDVAAPYIFAGLATIWVWKDVAERDFAPALLRHTLFDLVVVVFVAMSSIGIVALFLNYLNAREADKQRIKWVVLGLSCTFAGIALFVLTEVVSWIDLPNWLSYPWFEATLVWLSTGLALTVAYAVIRHRVIDVRFVLSRSLVFGIIAIIVGLTAIGLDWLFGSRLTASRYQAAFIAGVALVVGFLLNAARQRIESTVDALLFSKRHRTQQRADVIGDALRRASSKADLHEPLTKELADAFSLASAALFERTIDAGFVRVAAVGWPTGMIWHVFPDDQLARLAERKKVADIDSLQWQWPDVPLGVTRPATMIPILVGKTVPAVLLCGAHENGTVLDPDEIRTIRRLCADAGLVYAATPGLEKAAVPLQRSESLGA